MGIRTGNSAVRIHTLVRLLFETIKLNPAGLIRKSELFENYEDLGRVRDQVCRISAKCTGERRNGQRPPLQKIVMGFIVKVAWRFSQT